MFTHLRVQNLKSVADSGPIELAPLTFLMGPNSSGKSTLIQAILIARQTVDSRDVENPLVIEDEYVNLGTYRELIHQHDQDRSLALEFGFDTTRPPLAPMPVQRIVLRAEFSYNRKTLQIYPTTVKYSTLPERYTLTRHRVSPQRSTCEIADRGHVELRRKVPSGGKFYDVSSFLPFPAPGRKAISEQQLAWQLGWAFTREFETQLRRTYRVGPLRTSPKRTYVAAGETPQDVGLQGESTFAILWAARWKPRLKRSVFKPVNRWLQEFGISANLELKRIGGSYFTALVTDPALGVWSNFADVGFGASQLLPALVEALYAEPGSTIIMEQPEIHLHPAAQASLGDLFLETAQQRKQLIVETHSDHLVSRVLRRIAEGSLPASQVAIYYCEATAEGTQVRRIPLDEFGRFGEGLPSGFFDQGYAESIAHVEAVAKRVKARPDDGA
jgi:energy-coupling factor transporter ATP-binding protein EcfA2